MKKRANASRWLGVHGVIALLGCVGLSMAANPPERVNFQGVLRTSANAPVDDPQAITLRLFDSEEGCPGGGTLLLTDQHASVSVVGGLFNVALGGGSVTPGEATSLSQAFQSNTGVWVEIEVAGETLCPRVRMESSPYALSATGGTCSSGGGVGVAKTGQTECWNENGTHISCEGTGQDGDLLRGISVSPRFTDNGDGTVRDNLTGLIWLQDANCFGNLPWAMALTTVNNLDASSCGLLDGSVAGDWRLPNVKELQSLIDYGQFDPAIPAGHPFSGAQGGGYWSSTAYGIGNLAWFVDFFVGGTSYNSMDLAGGVWPVRGGS